MKPIAICSFIAAALCSQPAIFAQKSQKLNLEKATVFLKGAELVSTAKITLNKGENELVFTNVAGGVNSQSIVANATNGAIVESVTFQDDYTDSQSVSPRVKEINDSIEMMQDRRAIDSNKLLALEEQIAILKDNRKINGANTSLSTAELLKMLELAGSKMEAYLNQKNKVQKTLDKMNERIEGLANQLEEEQKKDYQPGGRMTIKFYAKENTPSNITISYVVPNAGWSPTYDVRVDDVKSPVQFYYKANIFQNTGVAWNNVRLTLSTGNPQEGMEVPVLTPFYLAFYQPPATKTKRRRGEEIATDMNTYTWANKVTSSAANLYSIDGVTVKGGTGADMAQGATGQMLAVDVDNAGVNTTFDIDLPYTIPSDGQAHLVAVKRYETPAIYEYYSAPKADQDAFLLAKITNWQDLNLLPGNTNIFYEGTYVGEGAIDTRNIKDTMSISLGRDKKIIVKRERNKMLRSVKMIGSNVKEEFAYTATVRNTRKEPVTITVEDQLPVSNDKDISVEDIETAGAAYEEATGIMKWPVTLKANETREIKFSFTVKYPKGKTINIR